VAIFIALPDVKIPEDALGSAAIIAVVFVQRSMSVTTIVKILAAQIDAKILMDVIGATEDIPV